MRTRCGWCGDVLIDGDPPETTGICADCEEKYFPAEVVAFDWQRHLHPSQTWLRGPRRVTDLSVPWFVRPVFAETDLYGAFLLVCSLVAALLLGHVWGAA